MTGTETETGPGTETEKETVDIVTTDTETTAGETLTVMTEGTTVDVHPRETGAETEDLLLLLGHNHHLQKLQ